jgi:hypothetical protein
MLQPLLPDEIVTIVIKISFHCASEQGQIEKIFP